MYQEFFTRTIESKFIKNILYNTPLPTHKVVRDGDYVFENNSYIYDDSVIKVNEGGSGYLNFIPANAAKYMKSSSLVLASFKYVMPYVFGKQYKQFTEKYISEFGYYDSGTHEKLGDYLRCIRNLYDVDLMPFYNCYSGRYLTNLCITKSHFIDRYTVYTWNKYAMSISTSDTPYSEIISASKVSISYANAVTCKYNSETSTYLVELINPVTDIPEKLAGKYFQFTLTYIVGDIEEVVTSDVCFAKVDTTITKISDTEYEVTNGYATTCPGQLPEEFEELTGYEESLYPIDGYSNGYWYKLVNFEKGEHRMPSYALNNYMNNEFKLTYFPIKFNQDYTIAIESDCEVYMVPAFIKNGKRVTIVSESKAKIDLTENLYSDIQMIPSTKYKHPFLFRVSLDSSNKMSKYLSVNEKNLCLLIQIPFAEDTTITVLEGDYTKNDECTNYFDWEEIDTVPVEQRDRLILSNLNLLKLNDRHSYAFSHRLIEYLTKNVITPLEEIDNNITLVQESKGIYGFPTVKKGIWDEKIRLYYYMFMMKNNQIEHYDLTGYIDRDTEKWYVKAGGE